MNNAAVSRVHGLKGMAFAAAGDALGDAVSELRQHLKVPLAVAAHVHAHPQRLAPRVLGGGGVGQGIERLYHVAFAPDKVAYVLAQNLAF